MYNSHISHNTLFILGFSKITHRLLALVDKSEKVVVFTHKDIHMTEIQSFEIQDSESIYASVEYVAVANEDSGMNINLFFDLGYHILLVNCRAFSYLFSRSDMTIISVCRKGLLDTYSDILLREGGSGHIISFDNDKSIAVKAQGLLPMFKVKSGVAHLLVPYCNDNKVISAIKGYLVFPPLSDAFKAFFPENKTSDVQITYTISSEAYSNAVTSKLIDINIVHTIACLFVFENHMYEFSTFHFSDLPETEKNDLIRYVMYCHAFLHEHWEHGFQFEDLNVSASFAMDFLKNLFCFDELVTRGIDPSSEESMHKLKAHMAYFSGIPEIESDLISKSQLVLEESKYLLGSANVFSHNTGRKDTPSKNR